VIAHEYVGMNSQRVFVRAGSKEHQVVLPVVIVEEYGAPIDAAPGDMNWNAWDLETSLAGHGGMAGSKGLFAESDGHTEPDQPVQDDLSRRPPLR